MPANNDPVAKLLTLAAGLEFIGVALVVSEKFQTPASKGGAGYMVELASRRARELGKVMWSEDYQPATRRRTT